MSNGIRHSHQAVLAVRRRQHRSPFCEGCKVQGVWNSRCGMKQPNSRITESPLFWVLFFSQNLTFFALLSIAFLFLYLYLCSLSFPLFLSHMCLSSLSTYFSPSHTPHTSPPSHGTLVLKVANQSVSLPDRIPPGSVLALIPARGAGGHPYCSFSYATVDSAGLRSQPVQVQIFVQCPAGKRVSQSGTEPHCEECDPGTYQPEDSIRWGLERDIGGYRE